jgi:hypothetical protein
MQWYLKRKFLNDPMALIFCILVIISLFEENLALYFNNFEFHLLFTQGRFVPGYRNWPAGSGEIFSI